jgi:hypothetical protein
LNREELRAKLEEVLYDNVSSSYDCDRVWSAWSYGTMRSSDFYPLEDRVPEIVEAMLIAVLGESNAKL